MEDRITFTPTGMSVVEGSVALELSQEDGSRLSKAFKHAGTWYIRERNTALIGGNVYAAKRRRRKAIATI